MHLILLPLWLTLVNLSLSVQAWVDPFFVVQHGPSLITGRLDPVVSPGGVSSHVHAIIGTSSFQPTYTYENSMAGRCTTANVAVDKSSYWAPNLYRKRSDGKFDLVKMNRANTYYLVRRGSQTETINEFPPGFRMLAGNPNRITYNASDYTNTAISYVCLGRSGAPETGAFPTQSCPQDLRAQVYFPSCWDGKNLWLPNSAHVAYPTSQGYNSGGPCPTTHPKRLFSVFYEFHFTDSYDYTPGARVWANGDDTGYALHADFTFGWPKGFLSQVIPYGEQCAVDFSLENCPPLKKVMVNNGSACTLDPGFLTVKEDIGVNGPIAKLPGNNPVFGRSGAKVPDPNYKETATLSTVTIPIPSGWTKLGCLAEPSGSRALKAASTSDQTMTPEKCISFCSSKGYSIAGVEWSVECYCGNETTGTSLSKIDNSLSCSMPCNGLEYSQGYCGGSSTLTIYQKGAKVVSSSSSLSSVKPSSSTSKPATSSPKTSTVSTKAVSTAKIGTTSKWTSTVKTSSTVKVATTAKTTTIVKISLTSTVKTTATTAKPTSTAKTSTTASAATLTVKASTSASSKATLNTRGVRSEHRRSRH
ncbi:hypothetical protein I316_04107 [Kwoniella heveanensis BCC8398]|uniref:WSC domain-containing protein n=1 Tax=Kwoniella heveanensis BCC8398 TaxID=1296120 RepID=A0A1B9GT43_9TREE|nr:hypothetical protein I316_04107 [Kwoniella heveanensis BCC8398]